MAVLLVGAVVCIASAIAGDTSQDLKSGFLVGATPRRQQVAEIIGIPAAAAMGIVLELLLGRDRRRSSRPRRRT